MTKKDPGDNRFSPKNKKSTFPYKRIRSHSHKRLIYNNQDKKYVEGYGEALVPNVPMADGAMALYNKGFTLALTHVPSDRSLHFGAFLEQFSDAYNSEWNAEHVFGRMDPIATFMHTRRAISVAWKIPSASLEEAIENLNKVNELMTYLYPQYDGAGGVCGATTINMAPLMRVRFGNLIQDGNGNKKGLLGYVNGFTMDPIIEDGMYMFDHFAATSDKASQIAVANYPDSDPLNCVGPQYLPKTIRLNFELTALHEHSLGWSTVAADSKAGSAFAGGMTKGFPYAVSKSQGSMPFTNAFRNSNTTKKPSGEEAAGATTPSKAEVKKALESGSERFKGAYAMIKAGTMTADAMASLKQHSKEHGISASEIAILQFTLGQTSGK